MAIFVACQKGILFIIQMGGGIDQIAVHLWPGPVGMAHNGLCMSVTPHHLPFSPEQIAFNKHN